MKLVFSFFIIDYIAHGCPLDINWGNRVKVDNSRLIVRVKMMGLTRSYQGGDLFNQIKMHGMWCKCWSTCIWLQNPKNTYKPEFLINSLKCVKIDRKCFDENTFQSPKNIPKKESQLKSYLQIINSLITIYLIF